MNHKDFSIIFGMMAEYFGATPSSGIIEIYFQSFKDWPSEDFKKACQSVMQNRVFNGLPKIAEIREALYGRIDDLVALAWESLMKALREVGPWESVIFEDGAIGHSIEAMGGWEKVNGWTVDECRMRRKEFESIYLANLRRGNIKPKKMTGLIEAHNSQQDEWQGFTGKPKIIHSQIQELELKKRVKLLS